MHYFLKVMTESLTCTILECSFLEYSKNEVNELYYHLNLFRLGTDFQSLLLKSNALLIALLNEILMHYCISHYFFPKKSNALLHYSITGEIYFCRNSIKFTS